MNLKQTKLAAIRKLRQNLDLDTPEKRLLFEVVAQAVRDLQVTSWKLKKNKGHLDPLMFFTRPEVSFCHFAVNLDLSISYVQKVLRNAGLI